MKARVYYSGVYWYGEVYADWVCVASGYNFSGEGWRDVTEPCFTKVGATIALKLWIRKNKTYDVKI